MASTVSIRFPAISAEKCVHALSASARCSRCADACPVKALQLTESSLAFDEEACTGCGHCRAACTEDAISFEGENFAPLIDTGTSEALIACAQAVHEPARGVVTCLHAVPERDLAKLGKDGIAKVLVTRGACGTCTHKPVVALEERAAAVNRLHGAPAITLQDIDSAAWRSRAAAALAQGRHLDHGRRALFAGFLRREGKGDGPGQTAQASMLARYAPQIDAAACVGCDACARSCPHNAITLQRDAAGLHYALDARACTGCGVCVDVCEDDAVTIAEFSANEPARIALHENRCVNCGTPFHEVGAAGPQPRCRICRAKVNAQKLYEVRS